MNKKALIAIAIIAILGVIGGTVAYFTNTLTFENEFTTKPYASKVTETFESPSNWTPGTTTIKQVFAENTGQVTMSVRAKIDSQSWTSANGAPLELTQNGNTAAVIKITENSGWTLKADGWYYYDETLEPGQKTVTSFIESVTFNPAITADSNCVKTGTTMTCTSTGNGYDGATYRLNIIVETIQADARATVWGY